MQEPNMSELLRIRERLIRENEILEGGELVVNLKRLKAIEIQIDRLSKVR